MTETDYPLAKAIGAILKEKMAQAGWTQDMAAPKIGMSLGTLNELLNGGSKKEKTVIRNAERVCKALGMNIKEVLYAAKHGSVYGLRSSRYCIEIDKNPTLWYRFCGTGNTPILPKDIHLHYDEARGKTLEFPPTVERLMSQVLREREEGKHTFENNPLLTVFDGIAFPPKGIDERDSVELKLGATDYAVCYALRRTEEGQEYFRKLVSDWTPENPFAPITAQGLGVNVAVLSNDDHMMFGRRFRSAGARPYELDVGAVEGFALMDFDVSGHADVADVMVRGVSEEYGVGVNRVTDVKILGFGYDLQWAQWNFLGVAHVDLPARRIRARHKGLAAHGAEYRETLAVPATPHDVFTLLASETRGVWSCGLATAYYTLVHLYGADEVDDAAEPHTFTLSK